MTRNEVFPSEIQIILLIHNLSSQQNLWLPLAPALTLYTQGAFILMLKRSEWSSYVPSSVPSLH